MSGDAVLTRPAWTGEAREVGWGRAGSEV